MKSINRNRSLVILAASLAFAGVASAATETFDALKAGSLPSSWETIAAGGYDGGNRIAGTKEVDLFGAERAAKLEGPMSAEWQIVADADARSDRNVLLLSTQRTDAWCVKSGVSLRDGYVEVQGKLAKPVAQHLLHKDPNAPSIGVIWRYQDANNFYYAYTQGSDLKTFKMVDGEWDYIARSSPRLNIDSDQWHTVRVEFTGGTFKIMLDGRKIYSVVDQGIHAAGAVGVAVHGDTSMHFDNLKYAAFPASGFEDFEDMELGPPRAPWVHGNDLDLNRTDYPVGTADWRIIGRQINSESRWEKALKQYGFGTMPYAVKSDVSLRDGYVEVEGLSVDGEHYRLIALIFRWLDADNYYIARASMKDNSLNIYKVIDGARSFVGRSPLIDDMSYEKWHTLRVEFSGNDFDVFWNGKKALSLNDDSIAEAGAVGMWLKFDAVTLFDNFSWGRHL